MNFSTHIQPIFALRGKVATYTPPNGQAVSCRVIRQGGGAPIMVGPIRLTVERTFFHIRRAEIGNPVSGATLVVGGESFTVDAVQPVERDVDGLMWSLETSWGLDIVYRSIAGSGVDQSPPLGSGFTVAANAAADASAVAIKSSFTVGKLIAGDKFTIAGDATIYTVTGNGVKASGNQFVTVPINPPLVQAVAAGAEVAFDFLRDYVVRAAVAGYSAGEIGGGVQVGDRRLVILQSALDAVGMADAPKAGDRISFEGADFIVQAATAIYRGAAPYAWDVQVRA